MRPPRFLCVVAVLVAFSSIILSCGPEDRAPGYVYYRLKTDPTTLDPALIVDVTGGSISAKLFDGLVRLGDDLGVVPGIAESWSVSADGLRYTFRLRSGVRFSNGREVTAEDFRYSFQRVLHPETKSPRTWLFDYMLGATEFTDGKAGSVEGIEVLDARNLRITLSEPFAPFLGFLTMPNAYVVPREDIERLGPDFSAHPVGTGPYVLEEWLPNRHLKLKRNDGYFAGKANVTGLFYRVIPEELTAVAEFELGNLDVIEVPAAAFTRYKRSEKWSPYMTASESLNTYYLGLNCSRPPFNNAALRRAVNLAIDRSRILDTLYEGRGRLASGPVPDVLRTWDAPPGYGYEPERAWEIISNEGATGAKVEFYINADQQVVDMAEVIQAYLKQAGLDVRITQLEWSAFKEAVNSGKADMFWLSWWADYPDPENFLFPLFHSSNLGPGGNRVMYVNEKVDSLIEAGRRAADPAVRNSFYRRAEGAVVADAPWVFFWHRTDYLLRQPLVSGVKSRPVYTMDKGMRVNMVETQ